MLELGLKLWSYFTLQHSNASQSLRDGERVHTQKERKREIAIIRDGELKKKKSEMGGRRYVKKK